MAFLNNGSKSSKRLDEGNVIWDWLFFVFLARVAY